MPDQHVSHTPGPWRIDPDYADTIQTPGGLDIANTCRTGTGWEQQAANARLIAAAPELLAALRQLRQVCDLAVPMAAEEFLRHVADADAAIAKAEGRTDAG